MSDLVQFNGLIQNDKTQTYLEKVLGDKKASFVSNITALVSNNASLQRCDPLGILYAGIKATALDLPLDSNLGFAYVIPYGNMAQFQIGYKGLVQLAIRSGQFKTINVSDVREGEMLAMDILTGETTFRAVDDREDKPIIGFVAYFALTNGFTKSLYMTTAQLRKHGEKYSKTFKNGKWATDFDAMARKTVLKLLLSRFAPLSVEMQTAIKADQSVVRDPVADSYEYIDNPTSCGAAAEASNPNADKVRMFESVNKMETGE